jgi:hypothetical protein
LPACQLGLVVGVAVFDASDALGSDTYSKKEHIRFTTKAYISLQKSDVPSKRENIPRQRTCSVNSGVRHMKREISVAPVYPNLPTAHELFLPVL